MSRGRAYTQAEKAQAVALAAAIGPVRASAQLGIPRTTLNPWLHQPAQSEVIRMAELDIATMLRETHAQALAAVRAGLADPKARLGDKATALRVLGDQLALAEGRATENIAINDGSASVENPFDRLDPEMAEYIEKMVSALLEMDFEKLLLIQEGSVDVLKESSDVG